MTRVLVALLVLAFIGAGLWMALLPAQYLQRWHRMYANYPFAGFFQWFVRDTAFNLALTRVIGALLAIGAFVFALRVLPTLS